ncbi:type IV secretion system protein VirB6 [Malonomonas rubra DSM 5091]|uniref:Type IV secretion system protein VirB6 n=1 Tax=Malonomonas rubra DSM 5091 TaxID=1122189 RepID=A0A1M6KSM8_MALRU|nr:type IV secretion system protein [Malonomonas rubra]SHJ61933.1 type IV secretion system protein VirB6 [Malonomonas rubra DSM 5091]
MPYINVFQRLFEKLGIIIDNYIVNTVGDIITFINPIVNSLLIIYLALWGIAHIRGTIQEPLKDGLGRFLRVVIVLSFALNVGMYSGIIADFLIGAPEQISGVVTTAAPTSALLDDLINKGFALGKTAWDAGGILDPLESFVGIIIWVFTVVTVTYAAFLLLFAKLAMVVLLALGPIFIVFLLFSATQRFFELWLGQVFNYALVLIISVSLIDLMFFIFQAHLTSVLNQVNTSGIPIGIGDTMAIGATAALNFLVLRQAPQISMALGGGIALATQGFISTIIQRSPMLSWLNRTTKATARGAAGAVKTGSLAATASAGNLYRRRFGGNSITGQ